MKKVHFATNRFVGFGLMVAAGMLLWNVTPAAATNNTSGVEIRLWSQSDVTDPQVKLHSIASVTGDEIIRERVKDLVLSTDLPAGRKIVYRAHEIVARLGDAGFDVSRITLTGAASCVVNYAPAPAADTNNDPSSQTGLSVDKASKLSAPASLETSIREMICRNLQTKGLPKDNQVKISFNPALRDLLALTNPPYTFDIVPQRVNSWIGLVAFKVKVNRDGKTLQSLTIMADVQVRVQLLVAAKTINAKTKIGNSDVERTWHDLSVVSPKIVTDLSNVVDQRAKKMIQQNTVITSDLLEPVPMVRRGQLVSVIYQKGGLEIKTVGKTLQTAFKDEIVQVRNERSKEIFRARVIGSGQVVVEENLVGDEDLKVASLTGGSNS